MSIDDPLSFLMKKTGNPEPPLSRFMQEIHDKHLEGYGAVNGIRGDRDQESLEAFKAIYEGYSPGDFGDYESKTIAEMIKRDKQKVIEKRNESGQKEKTERGLIFEKIFFGFGDRKMSAERFAFFGDDTCLHETTEYDDRMNHADAVLELAQGSNSFLSIDFTTSTGDALNTKINRVREELNNNRLFEVRYLDKEFSEQSLTKPVPMVIIPIDNDMLEDLCKAFDKGSDDFSEHPYQVVILKTIEEQLKTQIEIIEENEKKEDNLNKYLRIKNVIEKTLSELSQVIENKKSSLPKNIWERAERIIKNKTYYKKVSKLKFS